MNIAKKILQIILHDDKPMRRLMSILLIRLPFDIEKLFRVTIKIQDYFIYLHQSSMAIAFWYNPDDRVSDYKFITSYLRESDVYIDVGANIGTTLIPAAKSIKDGKAIGFEPHPKTFSYLKENIVLNHLENSVELHNCALGSERGSLSFSSNRNDDTNQVLLTKKGIEVPVKLLDDIGEKYAKIDLLKIDVEGYELFVVEGGVKTLEKTECIYFEVSEEHFGSFQYSMEDLLNKLTKIGFHCFLRTQSDVLKAINCDYKLSVHHTNAFAIRNIEDFIKRTGWRIDDVK